MDIQAKPDTSHALRINTLAVTSFILATSSILYTVLILILKPSTFPGNDLLGGAQLYQEGVLFFGLPLAAAALGTGIGAMAQIHASGLREAGERGTALVVLAIIFGLLGLFSNLMLFFLYTLISNISFTIL